MVTLRELEAEREALNEKNIRIWQGYGYLNRIKDHTEYDTAPEIDPIRQSLLDEAMVTNNLLRDVCEQIDILGDSGEDIDNYRQLG